jgi:sugar lactone lactonase YvrE
MDFMKKTNQTSIRVAALSAAGVALLGASAHAAAPQEILIPGDKVFPESMTSTPEGAVIIGSIGTGQIYRAKAGSGTAQVWIPAGTDAPAGYLGVFADPQHETLWACSLPVAGPGVAKPVPSMLHAYDLTTGRAKGHYPYPTAGGVCNDAAVGADGTIYATDTSNMQVLRLKPGAAALEVWAGEGGFGPVGGVLDGIAVLGNRVIVNALATSKLFSVPVGKAGKAGKITEVKLDQPLDRPDGMRSFGKNSLLVAQGGSAGKGKLSLVTLKGDKGTVRVLSEGYPDTAVAVTVVGTTAYVLEGQFAAMRGPNPVPVKPFKATAVEVGKP